MKRVTELIVCPSYRGPEYDETKYNGHAVEAVLKEHLVSHGFQDQVEVKYRDVVGHVDFMREVGDYVEFIEVKNTAAMKYTHLWQAAVYKSMLAKVYNKPTVGHVMYVKFETVFGEAPVRPAWVPADWKYIHIDLDSGEHYVNWALFRATWQSKIAGPYCATCQASCRIRYIIRKGPKEAPVLEAR